MINKLILLFLHIILINKYGITSRFSALSDNLVIKLLARCGADLHAFSLSSYVRTIISGDVYDAM